MGQLRHVVERVDTQVSAMRLRRSELGKSESKEQRKQDEPSSHRDLCLSAAENWSLRGKA